MNKATAEHTADKVEIARPLPQGWRLTSLNEVCVSQTGIKDPRKELEKEFIYVDITSVDNQRKHIVNPQRLRGCDAPSRARQIIRTKDILVSTTRPNLNAVALVPTELDNQICSTGFCVLRPINTQLTPEFLFLFVQSKLFVESLSNLVRGALYPAVTDNQVRNQLLPLPPLPEQKRIAAILNEQMAAVEKSRAAAEEQLDAAQSLPAAYLRSVFNSPEAQKWPRKKLETVGLFESGGTPSKENESFWDGDIPFVTGADITDFYITRKNARAYLSHEGLNSGKTAICNKGTVLFVTRTRVGRVGIASETMGASQDLSPYICGSEILPEYACRYLLSISDYLIDGCRGATIQGLTRDFIRSIEIPLPSIKTQQIISETVDKQTASAKIILKSLEEQLNTINKLPSALLKRAFNGEF